MSVLRSSLSWLCGLILPEKKSCEIANNYCFGWTISADLCLDVHMNKTTATTTQIPQAVFVHAIRLAARTSTGYPLLDERNRNQLTEMGNTLTASGFSAEEMDKFNSIVTFAMKAVRS